MATFDELAELLGQLKGARASVLWALSLAGRPLSRGELLALTGYSRKPIRRAVTELLALGLIRHDGPRVLALSGDWPFRVLEAGPAGAGGRSVPGERPATSGNRAADPAESAPLAERSAADPAASDRPMAGRRPKNTAAGDESTGRPAKSVDEGQMAEALEARRRAFLAQRMAGAADGLSAETAWLAAGGQKDRSGGRLARESGPSDPGQPSVVVADHDPYRSADQQQQQIPDGAAHLATLLRRMDIHGRAFWRLVQRPDLAERPELVLAWWWYYRVQEGVRNPAGASISRLDSGDRPPEGYLALAQIWPTLDDESRQELESLVLHNWSAEQIAARLRPDCPGLTAAAVLAFMTLSLEELEI